MDEFKNTSYSACLEKMANKDNAFNELNYTMPRKVHSWVDDGSVKNCQNCGKAFSLFLRKHHCRLCGKIFCNECSNFRQSIPNDLLSEDSKKGTWNDYLTSYITYSDRTKHRVCIGCNKLINRVTAVKRVIDVFTILNLNINHLKKAGGVCKLWNSASNYCLSIFREIQYKLPTYAFTNMEKKILKNNAKFFSGHSKYLVQLLKLADKDTIDEYKKILDAPHNMSCWNMMCTRNCTKKLTSRDVINILAHCFRSDKDTTTLKKIALIHFNCNDRELKLYLPFLVYNIRHDKNGVIADYLIVRCIKNIHLLNALYWEIQMYPKDEYHEEVYKNLLAKLKKVFSSQQHENKFVKLLEGSSFVKIVSDIADAVFTDNKPINDIKNTYKLTNNVALPVNPDHEIKEFDIDNIQTKPSASRPIIIPCIKKNGKKVHILYKKEDVRKDQMIMNIINLMEIIVKEEEKIDLHIVNYGVLPTDKNAGIIEIVEEAETVYFVQEKIQSSILNYILEYNGDMKIKDLRDRFIKSMAAYCVITYLLGIGDRHLDNVMVTKDGRLFHIDFGYIMGEDPVFNNPGIRITHSMIEAIGGLSSNYYFQFKDECTKIYNCLRRNINVFMNLLLTLPNISDIGLTEEQIKDQVINRFKPGENEIDAKLHLVHKLEDHGISEQLMDFCHYHSKEKTVSSAVNRLKLALASLWSS